jgi:hypothetical protein
MAKTEAVDGVPEVLDPEVSYRQPVARQHLQEQP